MGNGAVIVVADPLSWLDSTEASDSVDRDTWGVCGPPFSPRPLFERLELQPPAESPEWSEAVSVEHWGKSHGVIGVHPA